MSIEKAILDRLKEQIDDSSYQRYIKSLKCSEVSQRGEIVLYANNIFTQKWISTKYKSIIEQISKELLNQDNITVRVELLQNRKTAQKRIKRQVGGEAILNPDFTFENFIVGSSNQFAYTTARSVADNPGIQYNPLFIYGGVGLGKTHLLQAIGNFRASLGDRVIYTTLEQFMNKFISHLRANDMDSFREYFRECDLLLIDDIQFLAKKEQTQEEFFHTFNQLHSKNKQIVLTSDRPPKSIDNLVDRLKSRFEWGLMSDIKPPELETKISIIRKKCEVDGIKLSKDVIYYLATTMGDNIREIEGALIKIGAMSAMLNQEITLTFVKNTIKEQLKKRQENITIDKIVYIVAKELNVKQSDIKSKKRSKAVVQARRVAIFLSRKLTHNTMPQIALYFGMKDHTTISHAMKRINLLIENSDEFKAQIEELENKISTSKE